MAAETIDLVREAQVFNPKILGCLALNRKIANTAIGRYVGDALAELEVPILKSDIGQRAAFAEKRSKRFDCNGTKTIRGRQRNKQIRE